MRHFSPPILQKQNRIPFRNSKACLKKNIFSQNSKNGPLKRNFTIKLEEKISCVSENEKFDNLIDMDMHETGLKT